MDNISLNKTEPSTPNSPASIEIILVAGLSGAGMSTALQVLEDLNFFTTDGIPPSLISSFYELAKKPDMQHFRGIAIGLNLSQHEHENYALALSRIMTDLRKNNANPSLFFLCASPEMIKLRYARTRRPHPLEREGLNLKQAMEKENQLLSKLKQMADRVLDTTDFSIHDLRREVQSLCVEQTHTHLMRVNIISFGFKYGVPSETDLVFDMRFLPNPYFDKILCPLTGLDQSVVDFIFQEQKFVDFRTCFFTYLKSSLPYYSEEGRFRLTLAIGCTGGRHRSVAMAELTAKTLRQDAYQVSIEHRHLSLGQCDV